MEIFISIFLFSSTILIAFVFYYQKETFDNSNNNQENSLTEWDCPECGFHVQLGDSCTYCYTQKPY